MGFPSLGLGPPLTTTITELGYKTPTPVQRQAIPLILAGRDVMAAAQTGTGKTAAFTLPLLQTLAAGEPAQSNNARSLVLVPTRELAVQIAEHATAYSARLNLRVIAVYGGVKINPQMMRLRKGADLLIATPGRLLDLHKANAIRLNRLETLVLDEADRMLDMGFSEEVDAILSLLPKRRQTLLFSATLSDAVRRLARQVTRQAEEIRIAGANTAAVTVSQWLAPVDKKQKPALLRALIRRNGWTRVLAFAKTRQGADRIASYLNEGDISAAAIHADKSQGARLAALAGFKADQFRVLIATDVAARGIDIGQLPIVVNVDLPTVAEDYIHRIGRTGRAGLAGEAISLVCADEIRQLQAIEQLLKKNIPRHYVDGFEPKHEVPPSRDVSKPAKPKRPKKTRPGKSATLVSNKNSPTKSSTNRGEKGKEGKARPAPGIGTAGKAARNSHSKTRKS